jgi:hypothetical protein
MRCSPAYSSCECLGHTPTVAKTADLEIKLQDLRGEIPGQGGGREKSELSLKVYCKDRGGVEGRRGKSALIRTLAVRSASLTGRRSLGTRTLITH